MKADENPGAVSYRSSRRLVVAAALGALTVFLGITRLGLIPWFSGASLSIMHIPVLLGALLEGPVTGMIIGGIFGIFAMIQANISASGIVDLAFRNPVVSIVPRVLFPVAAWLVYKGLSAFFGKFSGKLRAAAVPAAAFTGSLVHTALVLLTLALVVPAAGLLPEGVPDATVAGVMLGLLVANGLPEALAAAVLVSVVVSIWTGISSRKRSKISEM
ncbi:MAG: ECF transporter S component [Spirochaetes bacterium]|uniref:ECF transporter S component n=1 Tax=Candidatus Avitreponema avistercoris TaxID=2840705 RepID=A0A9D9EPQ7_9SPIR|nr:ECF transporter S component [Candidatus Avitreponema avistercoris]